MGRKSNIPLELLLRKALFSARIEGNPLTLAEAKSLLLEFRQEEADKLLPRRREILEIIKDHPHSAFDFIARRFSLVSRSTLHYDLKKLQDQGFVVKLGVTRASVYQAS